MKPHDNPYTVPIKLGSEYYLLYGICYDECFAWYIVGTLHEKGYKAHTTPKRVSLFRTVHCVYVDIHFKDEEQWTYEPMNKFPYYEQIPVHSEGK